jgi:DHA2 family multidrug resistance protein
MSAALSAGEASTPPESARVGGAPTDDELPTLEGAALWGVGVLLSLANFVAVLDLTITNVSVPTIAGSLGASISQATWIITSYAVAEAITVPLTGWLAGRFGSGRVFAASLVAFGLASLLCGFSPTIQVLVGWRVLQGLCGAPLLPLSQALLLRLFPARLRAAAMGLWGVTTLVAPIFGPILGGALCDGFGWPVIFLANVPLAAAGGLVAWRVLGRGRVPAAAPAPFDGVGLALLVAWVGLFQVMLDIGKDRDWFQSPLIVALAVGSGVSFVAFLIWELTEAHPIVDLKVFRHRSFAAGMVVWGGSVAALLATNVLTPLWLQGNLGYTATQAGLATSSMGVVAVAAAPLVAWLCGRIDPRFVTFAGVGWFVATTILRGEATTQMSFAQVYGLLLIVGAAIPAFFLPLTLLSMSGIEPEETANASGLSSFVRTVSAAFATSIVTTRWENYAAAYHADLAGRSPRLGEGMAALARAGLDPGQAVLAMNGLVDGQALLLATNRMFWDIAIFCGLGLAVVWLIPRPRGKVEPFTGH